VSRYSIPFFFNPSYKTVKKPLTEELGETPVYNPISWGEYRKGRADGDFDDYGSEIQIIDFLK